MLSFLLQASATGLDQILAKALEHGLLVAVLLWFLFWREKVNSAEINRLRATIDKIREGEKETYKSIIKLVTEVHASLEVYNELRSKVESLLMKFEVLLSKKDEKS